LPGTATETTTVKETHLHEILGSRLPDAPEHADEKRRILFVDDEPRVLEGLRRMLRPQRRVWDMVFCEGGLSALDEVRRARFDVVVSDMRMSGIDGAELLTRVKAIQPHSVRIILSGQTNAEAACRAVPAAHQFAAKPCEPDALKALIDRACKLRDLLRNDDLAAMAGGVDALPSLPRTYARLTDVLNRPDSSVGAVASVVRADVALSAKILQIANSAFFGLRRSVADVNMAVSYLGIETIRSLALSVSAFRELEPTDKALKHALEGEQSHALRVAAIAKTLFADARKANDAFAAALLHDVGKLVLASKKTSEYSALLATRHASDRPLHRAEIEALGSSHAEIGAYLLGIWGLPFTVVEAVARHHDPETVPHTEFDVLSGVHVADLLARELETGNTEPWSTERLAYLESLGVADKLDGWRAQASGQTESNER
jgi:putative nucleotidyltransferase with HDIG domain